MEILARLFFRPPEPGWRQHVISAFIALTAVALAALYYNLFAQVGSIQSAGHPQIALEQALVFNFCGKYGHLSPNVDGGGRFLQREKWPVDQTFSEIIVARYDAISRFCEKDFQRFLNGEHGLSLLLSALLLLPPDDSASTLAVKMVLFECIVLFLALYLLALFGAGLLPLSFVSMATVKLLLVQQVTVISQYPIMSMLLLFSSALLALLWPAVDRRKPYVLLLAGIGVGAVLALVYNWRTSYGLIMAVQVAVLLFIAALKYYRQDHIFRRIGAISGAVFIGFFAFQAALIWPLEKDIRSNYSHHPIWHPIVLGLGAFPNPLAEREGIKWEDSAGWQIAKRVDPNATYLGPTYDLALRSHYLQLWKQYPWEMVGIYSKGIFETSRTVAFSFLGNLAHILIRNGFVWFSILLSIAIGGYFLLSLSPRLAMFTTLMSAALIGVSLEGAVVMPIYTVAYQSSLVVGFEALLAMLMVFAFARVSSENAGGNLTAEQPTIGLRRSKDRSIQSGGHLLERVHEGRSRLQSSNKKRMGP